jgi:putative SOS response-associated peptidase YedK
MQRYCIVPRDAFYEWSDRGRQTPYVPVRTGLMAFAGLWESYRGPTRR